MKIKIGKYAFRLIVVFSVIHFLLALYYAYFCLGNDFITQKDFLKMLMGGIQVKDSGNLFCVILYLLPRCLFCLYVANTFMKDLKTNFLYIFLRTKKREMWLREVIAKTAISVVGYETIFGILIIVVKVFMQNSVYFSMQQFMIMLVMECLQLFMLALFSNMLLLFLSETTCVFGTLLELAAPILITGVVYENNGRWQFPAQCIPFNWGNYNYISLCNMSLFVTVLLILIFSIAIYIISSWRINKYELI